MKHCTCAPHHRPPCAWCVQRMTLSEAMADALLAQIQRDFPGEETTDEPAPRDRSEETTP